MTNRNKFTRVWHVFGMWCLCALALIFLQFGIQETNFIRSQLNNIKFAHFEKERRKIHKFTNSFIYSLSRSFYIWSIFSIGFLLYIHKRYMMPFNSLMYTYYIEESSNKKCRMPTSDKGTSRRGDFWFNERQFTTGQWNTEGFTCIN
jgi:hypothetical protein